MLKLIHLCHWPLMLIGYQVYVKQQRMILFQVTTIVLARALPLPVTVMAQFMIVGFDLVGADLIVYLETTFASLVFLPDPIREAVHFTSCKHISVLLMVSDDIHPSITTV